MSELALGQIKGLSVNSNKVTVPAGHTLYAPGHVVQAVSFSTITGTSTTSTTFVDTAVTASITPKFTSSKILVLVSASPETPSGGQLYYTIFRGTSTGVNLGNSTNGFGRMHSPTAVITTSLNMSYLDSPSTTSSQQYMFAIRSASGTVYSSSVNGTLTMTLLEVAA